MLKKLMITTAAAALMTGTAIAQSPTTPAPKMQTQAPMTQGAGGSMSAHFVTQQTADQWLASKFKGTDVMGAQDEKIGDVSDILFDKDGKVLAYIVGVGGFLGIGSKDVAIAPAAFQMMHDTRAGANDTIKLKLAMSKDDLKNAPEFKPYTASSAPTTGMGTGSRPMSGAARPAATPAPAPTPAPK